jgi:hypothetical protein
VSDSVLVNAVIVHMDLTFPVTRLTRSYVRTGFSVRCEHYFDFGNASQLTISVSGSDPWDAAKLATTNFLPSPVTS